MGFIVRFEKPTKVKKYNSKYSTDYFIATETVQSWPCSGLYSVAVIAEATIARRRSILGR